MGATQEDIPDKDRDASEVERAYLCDADGDPSLALALREAIRDGLAERRRARLREALQARAISHGYVRGRSLTGPSRA